MSADEESGDPFEAEAPLPDAAHAPNRDRVAPLRAAGFPKRLDGVYAVMVGALIVQVALHGFTAACELVAAGAIQPRVGGGRGVLGELYLMSFFVLGVAIPVGCVSWQRWLDWSVKDRIVLGRGRFERSPAEVVWAYFVPGVNAYRPLQDLGRLWRAENPFGGELPTLVRAWWIVTLCHLGLMLFDVRPGIDLVTAAGSALGVASNVLALMVLREFWQGQDLAGEGGLPPGSETTEGAAA